MTDETGGTEGHGTDNDSLLRQARFGVELRCELEESVVVQVIRAAARRSAEQAVAELVDPYRATDVRLGVSEGGAHLAFRFATASGLPLEVAMPREIAEQLHEVLTRVLSRTPSRTAHRS